MEFTCKNGHKWEGLELTECPKCGANATHVEKMVDGELRTLKLNWTGGD